MIRFTCEICGEVKRGTPLQVRRRSQAPRALSDYISFMESVPLDKWVCFRSITCGSDRCKRIAHEGGIPGRIYREFGDDA